MGDLLVITSLVHGTLSPLRPFHLIEHSLPWPNIFLLLSVINLVIKVFLSVFVTTIGHVWTGPGFGQIQILQHNVIKDKPLEIIGHFLLVLSLSNIEEKEKKKKNIYIFDVYFIFLYLLWVFNP